MKTFVAYVLIVGMFISLGVIGYNYPIDQSHTQLLRAQGLLQ
jgi:hypothetical protein